MTTEETKNIIKGHQWVIAILLGVVGFLAGLNVSGIVMDGRLNEHESISGHSVMEARMENAEEQLKELRLQYQTIITQNAQISLQLNELLEK